MFNFKDEFQEKFIYKRGTPLPFNPPRGNLYAGLTLDVNLEVNIAAGGASNVPSFQVARAIQKLEIKRGNDALWSISGEALAAKFLTRRGIEAKGNLAIAGDEANNVKGRVVLYLPFAPDDAARPQDYLMDTRAHKYEIAITWRDLTAVGTLFGTHTGALTVTDTENTISIHMDRLDLGNGMDGKPDAYQNASPLMRGIKEVIEPITATAAGKKLEPDTGKVYRGVTIFAQHEANANQMLGLNTILTNMIVVKDSQGLGHHSVEASTLHAKTSQLRGVGSGLSDGVYDLPFTRFGNLVDELHSNNVRELQILADVTKLANATYLHMIYDTTERQ